MFRTIVGESSGLRSALSNATHWKQLLTKRFEVKTAHAEMSSSKISMSF